MIGEIMSGNENKKKVKDYYYLVDFSTAGFSVATKEQLEDELKDDSSFEQKVKDGDIVIIKGVQIHAEVEKNVILTEE